MIMIEHELKQIINYDYNNIICFFFYGAGGAREYVVLVRCKKPCVRTGRHVDRGGSSAAPPQYSLSSCSTVCDHVIEDCFQVAHYGPFTPCSPPSRSTVRTSSLLATPSLLLRSSISGCSSSSPTVYHPL